MVEITIKRLIGLKGINVISEKEFETDLNTFKKEDFINFLKSVPKDNIQFLFSEERPIYGQEEEQEDVSI